MEAVARSGRIVLQATFHNVADDLVDPVGPLADILLPSGAYYLQGVVPVRQSLGTYAVGLSVPVDAVLGEWSVQWRGTVDGVLVTSSEAFEVRDVGQATTGNAVVDQNISITMGLINYDPVELVLSRPPAAVA